MGIEVYKRKHLARENCLVADSTIQAMRRARTLQYASRLFFNPYRANSSQENCTLPGGKALTFTSKLQTVTPPEKTIPAYRVMDTSGKILEGAKDPDLPEELCVKMYEHMVTLSVMDKLLYDIQRQGRISFYMTSIGEEATHIGSAVALTNDDVIYAQYREQGVLLWRGFGVDQCVNQCYGNVKDKGKGRQMPVHYGSKEHNFITISSPLGTQIPQAAGTAYAQKMKGIKDACTVVYFGEGAASEGDFHAALNFAATLEVPVLFFCRNNGYAISTPVNDQFRGDGIAGRGAGYGMDAMRVDGNDVFAVMEVTAAARKSCIENSKPVLVEAMSYRVGHHSTSDDSTRYRSVDVIQSWQEHNNPITRLRLYLESKGYWDADKEKELWTNARTHVRKCNQLAEGYKKPPISEVFSDVYDTLTPALREQKEELERHLQLHGKQYNLADFADS